MAKSKIINPAAEQEINNALIQPHNLFLADELLKIDLDAFNSTVSLGMRNAIGQLTPSLTVKMPLPFLVHLANEILQKVEQHKANIKTEYDEFYDSLK